MNFPIRGGYSNKLGFDASCCVLKSLSCPDNVEGEEWENSSNSSVNSAGTNYSSSPLSVGSNDVFFQMNCQTKELSITLHLIQKFLF